MRHPTTLSLVTQDYLAAYRCILEEMIRKMRGAAQKDSISYNFIVQMIPHHEAAIEMSRNLLQYTTFVPLQDIALSIIEEQTRSIENMQSILCSCCELRNSERELCRYQNQLEPILQTMFHRMKEACAVNSLNINFIREMIPHHMGAVEMSETTLQFEICPELIPILKAIIASQEKGIMQMRQLLRCLERRT